MQLAVGLDHVGLIQVPSWPGRGAAAQARITRLKAVSAVTSHVLPRNWRRKRLDRCTPSVRNTMRVGRPPQDRLALAEPWKDAARIRVEQARWVQVAAHGEQAVGLAQGGLGRREGASGASARRQGSWRVMPHCIRRGPARMPR